MSISSKTKLFLSYGRSDAESLADQLERDLSRHGYEVWRDTRNIPPGSPWQEQIRDGLRSCQLVIALLSPRAVRCSTASGGVDDQDSVCLDEISFARFSTPPIPIVPVMAMQCEPPLCIFRLDYVSMCSWRDSDDQYRLGLQRVLEAIEATKRGKRRWRSWVTDLRPCEDFDAVLHKKRERFCGREWLFREIEEWRTSPDERALLLVGDPGVGKSAIVAQLVHQNPGGQVLAYHCCMADTATTLAPATFIRSLAAMIASRLDEYAAALAAPEVENALCEEAAASDPGTSFERGILTQLEKCHAPQEGVRYILIDGLDESLRLPKGHTTIVEVLAPRIERFPPWLRLVGTTRGDPGVLDRLAGRRGSGSPHPGP